MKRKILDLIIDAKRDDPETGSFAEWLAEYLVANGVTVQRWIPVEEQLPEDGGRVIAHDVRDGVSVMCKFENGEDFPFADGDDRYMLCEFTHWMPKPPGKDVSRDG